MVCSSGPQRPPATSTWPHLTVPLTVSTPRTRPPSIWTFVTRVLSKKRTPAWRHHSCNVWQTVTARQRPSVGTW